MNKLGCITIRGGAVKGMGFREVSVRYLLTKVMIVGPVVSRLGGQKRTRKSKEIIIRRADMRMDSQNYHEVGVGVSIRD